MCIAGSSNGRTAVSGTANSSSNLGLAIYNCFLSVSNKLCIFCIALLII